MSDANGREFRPIPNPYIVGNPIEDGRMFFGREDDFAYLKQKFTGGTQSCMIVLCGTRRSGKTSILFQIRQGRLGRDYVPVLIDMQSVPARGDADFAGRLAAEILDATGLADAPFAERFCAEAAPDASALRGLLSAVAKQLGERKLVLMFDEYELFETGIEKGQFTTAVLDMLGGCLDTGVFVLFTGSDKLEERDARTWAPCLGRSLHRRISFLSRGDARRLVEEPLRSTVRHGPGVPEAIYELTAGQPFYTQVLCQSLVDHLNERESRETGAEDLEHVVQEIIENPLPHMIFTWSSLTALEKVTLSVIAELSKEEALPVRAEDVLEFLDRERIGVTLEPNLLHEALERLFIQDLLAKDEAGESYTFKMGLWRRWLSRMHSIWQVLDEVRDEDGALGEGIVPVRPRRRWLWAALLVPLVAMAFLGLRGLLWPEPPPSTPGGPVAAPDSSWLRVTTTPAGADVYLGGRLLGRTPLDSLRVRAGTAWLEIARDGYVGHGDSIRLAVDEAETLHVDLVDRTGSLAIVSEPPGARILLDGRDTGEVTPHAFAGLSVNVPHDVRLSLPAQREGVYGDLRVPADSTLTIRHAFRAVTHPLTIVSEPAGAEALLDGRPVGTTPQSLAAVSQGRHTLLLRRDGYHPRQRTVDVPAPGNLVRETLELLPPGTLVIRVQPYADIYVDGELKESGAVYFSQELPQGPHTVLLRHPHLGDHETVVEVRSEQTTNCDHDFERGSR
jgi:hypothetical protein